MRWVALPMHMVFKPSEEQIQAFLETVTDPALQPVFVHCRQGEDRTGVMVAIYRVAEQGWEPAQAYREAIRLGMAGWNPFLRGMIFEEPKRLRVQTAVLAAPREQF